MKAEQNNFVPWTFLVLFSAVALSAMLNQLKIMYSDDDLSHRDWDREERWVVSVASISLFLSCFACAFHAAIDNFTGSKFEIGMTVVVLAIWCAGLPAIMDPDNGFGMSEQDQGGFIVSAPPIRIMSTPNVFFSSWGALIVTLYLALRQFEMNAKLKNDKFLYTWVGLGIAGLIVLSDTAHYFKNAGCADLDDNETCRRTVFAIVLGSVTVVLSAVGPFIKVDAFYFHILPAFLLVAWIFGAAYLTFNSGPATPIGTTYFATWAALVFSLSMAATGFIDIIAKKNESDESNPDEEDAATKNDGKTGDKANEDDAEEEEVGLESNA